LSLDEAENQLLVKAKDRFFDLTAGRVS